MIVLHYWMQWFIRDSPKGVLTQVLSFYEAELVARKLSRINTTGIIETVVREDDGRTFVDAVFLRGRKLQRGQRARESSRLGLPPKV